MSAFVPTRQAGVPIPSLKSVSKQGLLTACAVTALAVTLGGVFFSRIIWPPRAELAELNPIDNPNASVIVESARADSRMGYLTVVGSFSNKTTRPLKNVEAVVEFFDSSRKLVGVDSALAEMPVVAPGGQSAFEVHSRDSGDITHYRIRFRHLLGGELTSARSTR